MNLNLSKSQRQKRDLSGLICPERTVPKEVAGTEARVWTDDDGFITTPCGGAVIIYS